MLGWGASAIAGSPESEAFAVAFVKDAAELKIPLYPEVITYDAVVMLHAQWRYSLPADDWAILGYIGKKAAARLAQRVEWAAELPPAGGAPDAYSPALWRLSGV